MSTKHTPGPWTSFTGTNSIWAEGKRSICIVTGARKHEDEERDANARLIAAAPDLLEALRAIAPFIPTTSAADGGAAIYSANVRAADMVRAAIAKATGATVQHLPADDTEGGAA